MKNIKSILKGDQIIWVIIFGLIIISILSVYSSIATLAFRYMHGNSEYYLFSHLTSIFVGLIALFLMYRVRYGWLFNSYKLLIGIALVLLVLTYFVGDSEYGAVRWLKIGPIRLQPSDLAKFAVMIYVARVLSVSQDNKQTLYEGYKKIILVVLAASVLIVPSNLSTAILLFIASMVLLFIGGVDWKLLLKLSLVALAILAIFVLVLSSKTDFLNRGQTWNNRVTKFISKVEDPQVLNAKSAIATSNIIGKGPGNSQVKYRLENASSDYIYAIIIEELGSLIGVLVLLSYLIILYRTGTIVKSISKSFPAFVIIGLTLNIVLQAIVNMAVAVDLIPVTGQPLPLVSWGGTSMVVTLGSLGVILNISKSVKEEQLIMQEKNSYESKA